MPETKCKCGCGRTPNPNRWPGDEGFDSALCRETYRLECERIAYAAHLRSPQFLASSLGLTLGSKP